MASPITMARRRLSLATHRIWTLPVLVLMPHSGCNCRCVMCDIWQAGHRAPVISPEELAPHMAALRKLGVQWVVLSGGEPLMHPDLWTLCGLLRGAGVRRISLLSNGLLLKRHARDVVRCCDEVIVSLDGTREVHDRIRNVARAYDRLAEGVAALKELAPSFRVTARCVIQRLNYAELPGIVDSARALGLDRISFLAADVSSTAFNRTTPWGDARVAAVALSAAEAEEFGRVLEQAGDRLASGFVAESPAKLRRLQRYLAAQAGAGDLPETLCNAPWVSTVVEADGTVRPCYFQRPLGNIHTQPLDRILNAPEAVAFRRRLDVRHDPVCRRCVCTLHLGPRAVVAG